MGAYEWGKPLSRPDPLVLIGNSYKPMVSDPFSDSVQFLRLGPFALFGLA